MKIETTKGRKPLVSGRRLTSAEKMERMRKKQEFLNEAMAENGYKAVTIFAAPEHIKLLSLIDQQLEGDGGQVGISTQAFKAFTAYFKNLASMDSDLGRQIANLKTLPEFTHHENAELTARAKFDQWSSERFGDAEEGVNGN